MNALEHGFSYNDGWDQFWDCATINWDAKTTLLSSLSSWRFSPVCHMPNVLSGVLKPDICWLHQVSFLGLLLKIGVGYHPLRCIFPKKKKANLVLTQYLCHKTHFEFREYMCLVVHFGPKGLPFQGRCHSDMRGMPICVYHIPPPYTAKRHEREKWIAGLARRFLPWLLLNLVLH